MTAFMVFMIACPLAALFLIAFALYRNKRVKTCLWLRSFGFFLEARNDDAPTDGRRLNR